MTATDDKDSVLARFMEGPALLDQALAGIPDSELDTPPSRGGWTIREIVHHVVDGDDLWKTFVKVALGNEQAVWSLEWYQGQPQEVWAEKWAYARRSLDVSLALLRANRSHIKQLLDAVPDGWQRSVVWRKYDGETTRLQIAAVVEMQAHHLEHHAEQIRTIRSELGGV